MLVLKGDEPNALLVHLDRSLMEMEPSVRPALAAALYKDGVLSLGAAARVSGTPLQTFIGHLGDLGIDVVAPDESISLEVKDLGPWLKS